MARKTRNLKYTTFSLTPYRSNAKKSVVSKLTEFTET